MYHIFGIEHRVDGVLGYQQENGTYVAVLKAPRNTITNLKIHFDDPYNWNPDSKGELIGKCRYQQKPVFEENDGATSYFTFHLNSREKRFKYYFSFLHQSQLVFLGEAGFQMSPLKENFDLHQFAFTWCYSTRGKYVGPASGGMGTSWYQVFPDRFFHPQKSLNQKALGTGAMAGGNLQGVITKLNYIQKLGFTGLYLNPIFQSPSSHKYDITDYYKIDSQFGTLVDFQELVQATHARKMRIMLDGVFNHASYLHPYWQDVVRNKKKSPYQDWFCIWKVNQIGNPKQFKNSDFYRSGSAKQFETFANTPVMPRGNLNNPAVVKYFCEVITFGTKQGIDAWRMDVADEIPFSAGRTFRQLIKNINPEVQILGEIWYDAVVFLRGDQVDATMNYPLRTLITDFFIQQSLSKEDFVNQLVCQKYRYSAEVNRGLLNFVGTHDTIRINQIVPENKKGARFAIAFLLLLPNPLSFFYGDEQDLGNSPQKETNRLVFNGNFSKNQPTYQLVKKILLFRNEHLVGKVKNYQVIASDEGLKIWYDNGMQVKLNLHEQQISGPNLAIKVRND